MSSVYSAKQLGDLAMQLGAVEKWLHDSCEARHAGDMAQIIGQAVQVIEDAFDEQVMRELAQ